MNGTKPFPFISGKTLIIFLNGNHGPLSNPAQSQFYFRNRTSRI